MTDKVLQIGRLLPTLEKVLEDEFSAVRLREAADPDALLRERGHEFTAVVCSAGIGVSRQVLDRLPALRVISSFGVGLDKIDLVTAAERGIAVGYTPDVLNDCVADLAITLMFDVARRSAEADRFVRSGQWREKGANSFGMGRRVSGAKLGIVGLGRIGRTIAKRVAGFDMPVRYHTRRAVADVPWTHEPSLIELARWADFLVVIVAGGAGTKHLIDADVLQALGPDGFLVNVSRGSVVDEDALVRALQQQAIAGAGLDVFADEPNVPEALLALDNAVLLPHIASNTRETRQGMADLVLANLRGFVSGRGLVEAAPLPKA